MTKIGYAVTGSFCTFSKTLAVMQALVDKGYELVPIFSYNTCNLDTRFYKAKDFYSETVRITGKYPICDLVNAEPLGTKEKLDLIVVCPCTGNTLSKLANGITDTCVTMAAKSHLRNGRPVLLAVATNDGLSGSAKNIGELLARKNIYFVPFRQDDAQNKPRSLAADYSRLREAIIAAAQGVQLQPILAAPEN